MRYNEVKLNYDYKTNLYLDFFQNADFVIFREKIKGTTFVFVRKSRKNVMQQGKIEFCLKIEKCYVRAVKRKTIDFFKKFRQYKRFQNACVVGVFCSTTWGGVGAVQIITQRLGICYITIGESWHEQCILDALTECLSMHSG